MENLARSRILLLDGSGLVDDIVLLHHVVNVIERVVLGPSENDIERELPAVALVALSVGKVQRNRLLVVIGGKLEAAVMSGALAPAKGPS